MADFSDPRPFANLDLIIVRVLGFKASGPFRHIPDRDPYRTGFPAFYLDPLVIFAPGACGV